MRSPAVAAGLEQFDFQWDNWKRQATGWNCQKTGGVSVFFLSIIASTSSAGQENQKLIWCWLFVTSYQRQNWYPSQQSMTIPWVLLLSHTQNHETPSRFSLPWVPKVQYHWWSWRQNYKIHHPLWEMVESHTETTRLNMLYPIWQLRAQGDLTHAHILWIYCYLP